ncbi:lecithin retinol acyltransferase b, tandem duplicate 2 [Clupea harengus]|uniref:Lecithin retinol acyltransferase b, tandem duplicate 2 n=1 Tax=Clupea harengus TaxID=7950 RepID=A0A6P3W3N8_CLUHA|nr:lecithin retinol acyltransferase b, tandem duplicate 2 [Clupea harengus]
MALLRLLSMFFLTITTTKKKQEQEKEDIKVNEKVRKYDISLYKRGDLLEVPRTLFTHFGIYLGNDRVAHLIPDILPVFSSNQNTIGTMVTNLRLILGAIAKAASVRVDSVEDFAYGGDILINPMDKVCSRPPYDGEEVARRAEKLMGPVDYSLLWYNCEHYVMYCRYGTVMSFQTFQFCKGVRKIFCSKRFSFVSALIGVAIMVSLQTDPLYTLLLTFFISFHIWMAS